MTEEEARTLKNTLSTYNVVIAFNGSNCLNEDNQRGASGSGGNARSSSGGNAESSSGGITESGSGGNTASGFGGNTTSGSGGNTVQLC